MKLSFNSYLSIGLTVIAVILLIYCLSLRNSRDNAISRLDKANQTVTGLTAYITKTKEQLKVIQKIDSDYQEKIRNVQADNDKLRGSIANGTKRLYVKAACPSLPANTATTSGTDATTPRLTGNTRQDYLRLRLEIAQITEQLLKLQSYVKNVCLSQ